MAYHMWKGRMEKINLFSSKNWNCFPAMDDNDSLWKINLGSLLCQITGIEHCFPWKLFFSQSKH